MTASAPRLIETILKTYLPIAEEDLESLITLGKLEMGK
jgi:hypothetical protein